MHKKLYLLIFFTILSTAAAMAQDSLDVHFSALGWLDNREYKAFIPRSRTYSGTRTELDLGLHVDTNNAFILGTNAIHEFGAQPYFLNAVPVAYYHYQSKKWTFNAGEFPREGLIDDYPRAMLNDTLMYYRPNIEGLYTEYRTAHFWQNGWIDWLSRQTDTQREEFIWGSEGKITPGSENSIFYIRDYFELEHDAGAAILQPTDHIFDNGAVELRLGLNLTKHTGLDSLSIEAGNLTSFLRERGADGWETRSGVTASVYAAYHRLAFFDEIYKGQGSIIYYGDSFYEKTFYNRLDVIWTPFLSGHVKGQFVASFHFSPGHFNDNQEVFRVTYDLGRKTIARFRDAERRN